MQNRSISPLSKSPTAGLHNGMHLVCFTEMRRKIRLSWQHLQYYVFFLVPGISGLNIRSITADLTTNAITMGIIIQGNA